MKLRAEINNGFDNRLVVSVYNEGDENAHQTRIFNTRKELADDVGKLSYWFNLTVIDHTIK